MPPTCLIYLALGSNVGNKQQNVTRAVQLLAEQVQHILLAPIYSSKPMGYTEQDDFINTALCGETSLSPLELLHFVKAIEKRVGRIERFRWGPREVDIDIIFYGQTIMNEPELTIPHPRMAERDFVLQPLAALDPDLVDPVTRQTVSQLLDALPSEQRSLYQQ